jgi:hypothetical protein
VAAGVLAGIGFVAFERNQSTRHRMYAAVPLLFAAQQAAEGTVWLTMDRAGQSLLQQLAVTAFLGFALVIWPLWMPVSLLRVEHDPLRRRVLAGLCLAGLVVAVCAATVLARWNPVAQVAGHSIVYAYTTGSTDIRPLAFLAAYMIPVVLPFFVSSASLSRTTGAALVISLVATVVIQRDALTSVWCFFAAILSGLILAAIILDKRLLTGVRAAWLQQSRNPPDYARPR